MLLKFIRKHTKLLFITILSLMVVPFLFWGIGSIGKPPEEKKEPLRIHGRTISISKLRQAGLDSQIMLLIDFVTGNNIKTPEQFDMYKDWFNQMINQIDHNRIAIQHLILQDEARQYGLPTTPDELKSWIENFPLFQRNGTFDSERYNIIVTNYFRTWPVNFEKALSRVLTTKKLQKFIMDTVLISGNEAYNAYKEKNEKAVVYYVEFNTQDFTQQAGEIDESEIKEYYDSHNEEFREPEKIKIMYLLFDPTAFKSEVAIAQKEIEDYYELNKDNFKDKDNNIKPIEDVKNEINEILTKQKAEEICQQKGLNISIELSEDKRTSDMIKLAKEKDLLIKETDFLSKEQGFIPELGWAEALLQTAWRMELETISDLLHTGDKWVIISPVEKKETKIPELQEVSNKIKDILKNKKAEELANKASEETFSKLPKDLPFSTAIKSLKLKPKKTKPVTRENELFTQSTNIVKTQKGYTITSPKEFQPVSNKKWEEEKEAFTKTFLEGKKRKFFQSWLSNIAQ